MNRFRLTGICLLILTLALSGCLAKTGNLTRDRVDQEASLSAGNRGYIMMQVPEPTVVNEREMESILSVFSEAIKRNPSYGGAYYNRAVAYFYKKDYERSWQDLHKAESLGCRISVDFLETLKKVSQRKD